MEIAPHLGMGPEPPVFPANPPRLREREGREQLFEPTLIVTEADLGRELALLRASSTDKSSGVFGPGSLTWRIDREAAVFLAAGRALLLQLAHPWVAAAVAEHSRSLADPIGRFHRTFGAVF